MMMMTGGRRADGKTKIKKEIRTDIKSRGARKGR